MPQPPVVPAAVPPVQQPTAAAVGVTGGLYAKAPLGARFLAVIADSVIASALLPLGVLLLYADLINGRPPVLGGILTAIAGLWQLGYTFGRDGARGAGFGKRMTGLVVVRAENGAPAGLGASIARQLVLWLLGIVPVIGSLIEPILVLSDKDGRRLGDKAAKTQVARTSDVAARGHVVAAGKAFATIVLVVAFLVSVGGGVAGGLVFARAVEEAANGGVIDISDTPLDTVTDDVTIDDDSTTSISRTPGETVDDFYAAVASGDFDAVLETFSAELAAGADPGMFEGWTTPSYDIGDVTQDGDDLAHVEVQEFDGGMSNGLLTYVLVLEDGAWKIDDWTIGGVGDNAGGDEGVGTGVLNPETAADAVGTLLVALQNDDVDTMRSVSTAYFQDAQSWFFAPSSGAFIDFEIAENFPDGAVWIVGVSEDWNSGPETVYYIVIDDNGQAKVDDLFYSD